MSKFQPPTIEQVKAYAREIGYPQFDAEYFWHHHNTRGWIPGSSKKVMTSWHSAVWTWIKRDPVKYPPKKKSKPKPEPQPEKPFVLATPEQRAEFHRDIRRMTGKMKPKYHFVSKAEAQRRAQQQIKALLGKKGGEDDTDMV